MITVKSPAFARTPPPPPSGLTLIGALVRHSFLMFFFLTLLTATLDQTVLNEMRRCTMVFIPKKSGARFVNTIRSISILFNFALPLQFTPQAAPRSSTQLHGYPEPSTSQIPQPELSEKGEKNQTHKLGEH